MTGAPTESGASYELDALTGRATVTARTMYLAAWTSDPGTAATPATAGEYAVTGYARQTMTPTTPNTSGSNRRSQNSALITFGPLTGATGASTITHLCLVSSSSGTTGDLVYRWAVDTSRNPAAGDSVQVAIGGVTANVVLTPLA